MAKQQDPWLLALERAKKFVRTFNVPDGFQHNLAYSYEAHGRLARKDERDAIVAWLQANNRGQIADDIAAGGHLK